MKKIHLLFVILLFQLAYVSSLASVSDLSKVDASRIVVKSRIKLSDEGFRAEFSPSGKTLFYVTKNFSQGIILNSKDLKIAKTFVCKEGIHDVTWHPSEEKIAYSTYENHLNILDLKSGKEFQLDYPGSRPMRGVARQLWDKMIWYSDSEIYFKSGQRYFRFNLEDLQKYPLSQKVKSRSVKPRDFASRKKRFHQEQEQRRRQKQKMDDLFSLNKHPKAYVYRNDLKGQLIVANKDGSYERVLREKFYSHYEYTVCPHLTSVVSTPKRKLYIYYLGIRPEPKLEFHLNLNKMKQLTASQRDYFRKYFEGGTIDGYFKQPQSFTIWGKVYSPKINPLNNKVVGADKKNFKGLIKFVESYDSYSIVRVGFEQKIIEEGDIVTSIFSNNIGGRELTLPSNIWAILTKSQ
jgi:hypothetical protein